MASDPVVVIEHLNHFFGTGAVRRQILFDICTEVRAGEIVLLTGPSGSGKTTLLTLIGALRSAQDGRLCVLGHELNGAGERVLVGVRRSVGYVFQSHNLLDALNAHQNVLMAVGLREGLSVAERRSLGLDALKAVGLGDRANHFPGQLSGGQKQRVAIARALVNRPRMILADEPTASLDKQSGRDVVQLMHDLAKQRGCAVLLVTHDNRILDIADRILHLEDGRLESLTNAVASNTRQMFGLLADNTRKGELSRQLSGLSESNFLAILERLTGEFEQLLRVIALTSHEAFESVIEQLLEAFTYRVGELLGAERVSLFLVDDERQQLWSKVAQTDGSRAIEIRIPLHAGVAGHVARTGEALNVPDAYQSPLFDPEVDAATGYRTRSLLCVPLVNHEGRTFAVAELLNKRGGGAFDAEDQRRFHGFAASIAVILETWWQMATHLRRGRAEVAGTALA